MTEVALSILRPLHADLVLPGQTHSVKDLCISHCRLDTEAMERYVGSWSLKEYSCMAICGNNNTALTLVPLLSDRRTHGMFTRVCFILRWTARDFPMSRYILQGLEALAWSLKQQIPSSALAYFTDLGSGKEDLRDVPVAFMIPRYDEMQEVLSDDGADSSQVAGQLGVLLAKWSALSLE